MLDLAPLQVDMTMMRLIGGFGVIALLGYWTLDRLLGDRGDPSIILGGNWTLIRVSGIALIGLFAVLAGVLLMPWMNAGLAGILVLLVVGWFALKEAERD